MQKLQGLQPERVFEHFEALTRIPRESGQERAISNFLVQFAKDLNLEVIQDERLNVIIKKPATPGYENHKRVILQGHMDMVCVKRDDLDFNFSEDPIPLVVDGDWIKTEGTTLGADNGIAVAMAMAILESNEIQHPPLTVLITVEEETGMFGASGLNPNDCEGDILINIDSEEEGVLLTSCAGGVRALVSLPLDYQKVTWEKKAYLLTIHGLKGGHSGIEIDKHRGNAIKLLGRLLYTLNERIGIDISFVMGGEKMNAIARSAKARIYVNSNDIDEFQNIIQMYQEIFANELKQSDPNVTISIEDADHDNMVFGDSVTRRFIHLLRLFPNGIQSMSASMEGLVESSLNVGVLEIKDDYLLINAAVRSSVKSRKMEIVERIESLCELTGAKLKLTGEYPEWEYEPNSPIRDLMIGVYRELYGKEPQVAAIHAGLECGYFKEKWEHIDLISLGPNIRGAHTPEERLSISSTKRVYEFLCEVLRRI